MNNIDHDRVEERFRVEDVGSLVKQLNNLSFEKKYFSDQSTTLTYFCDSQDFALPENERVKIRTYVSHIPESIDFNLSYKLDLKTHKAGSLTKKEVVEGSFKDLLKIANDRLDVEIAPLMAMSYNRSHFVLPGNSDIRITLDQNIVFYKITGDKLAPFHEYEPIILEIKYNPTDLAVMEIVKRLIASIECEKTHSKKDDMYRIYRSTFLES